MGFNFEDFMKGLQDATKCKKCTETEKCPAHKDQSDFLVEALEKASGVPEEIKEFLTGKKPNAGLSVKLDADISKIKYGKGDAEVFVPMTLRLAYAPKSMDHGYHKALLKVLIINLVNGFINGNILDKEEVPKAAFSVFMNKPEYLGKHKGMPDGKTK